MAHSGQRGGGGLGRGLALGMAAAWLASCGGDPGAAPDAACRELRWSEPPRRRNVVLIVSDTLRQDYLGLYGGFARTPAFDAFGREHLWFAHASTQAPWTLPSMATLFTSLFPSQHRMTLSPLPENLAVALEERTGPRPADQSKTLATGYVTLAEVLRDAGYRTGAFVTNPWLSRALGFAQGFEDYDDSLAGWDAPGERVSEAGLEWVKERNGDEPFFLYLHFMDAHRPHPSLTREDLERHLAELQADERPLPPSARRAIGRVVRIEGSRSLRAAGVPISLRLLELTYAKGVEAFDHSLERFLEGFESRPEASESVVIVTSDHGEALFTRGYANHGLGLYDDEVAIPLAIRLPGVEASQARVGCPVGLIDLFPTLCSYLGVACPPSTFGRSLIHREGEPAPPRYVVTEGVANQPDHRAIRNGRYKLIFEPGRPAGREEGAGPYALFDTVEDPDEMRDLLAEPVRSPRSERVFEMLSAALPDSVPPFEEPEADWIPIDPELRARLEALGYGGGDDAAASPGSGAGGGE